MNGYDEDDWLDRHMWVIFIPIAAAYALMVVMFLALLGVGR